MIDFWYHRLIAGVYFHWQIEISVERLQFFWLGHALTFWQRVTTMKTNWLVVLSVALTCHAAATAKELVESGDMVAVIGDSITEQKQYSVFIEDYLLMCQPAEKLQVAQFGWGGETATGFEKRMKNDMLRFKPMLITTCFGMNDGGYGPLTKDRADLYRDVDAEDHR